MKIVSTPGHTLGHQSVLLEAGEGIQILFAGDTSFNEKQLVDEKVGGINLDIRKSKRTLQSIKQFSKEQKLVYLPSHDPESAPRLEKLKTLET